MTNEVKAFLLAHLLDGASLELFGVGGGHHPAPVHRLELADVKRAGDADAEIDYTWTFGAPGPAAHGYRLTRGGLVVEQEVFDKPLEIPVAGTEIRGHVRLSW